ncbi:MAG: N-acetylmuramidase domain-containing protein [Rhizobiaceae bacterium]|nr:N-acetylmuramidase domain-containing protein [Rhizobiaceae bacterium]
MFSESTKNEIAAAARAEGLEPAALLAVSDVESGGQPFARVEGRDEPLIRFEGHYFNRLLPKDKRTIAMNAGLASSRVGGVANPRTQEGRWKLLNRAAMIDRQAAMQSTSWGLGQVMGVHWEWLGYGSVDALVSEARSGAAGQARLMLRFIVANGLREVLKDHDWEAFAHRYNGPAYRRNGYHTKMAAAYRRYARDSGLTLAGPLKRGASGESVVKLQQALAKAGFPLDADGRFGLATETALRAFQRKAGIGVDGIAGADTFSHLKIMPKLEQKSLFSFSDPLMWMHGFRARTADMDSANPL